MKMLSILCSMATSVTRSDIRFCISNVATGHLSLAMTSNARKQQ